ncbi:shikimate dehydrogenase [Siminovitchia sp. 179-K 8D1 HS]|uniref:shikimate dehydrogenase n=1 Tax=Siminovitchia sp. 179-K 8D1 HS TaxID=3142385 RepID=UPI0039A13195
MKKLYGIIGDPVSQSLSPQMHNQEFEKLGIAAYYHPFRIAKKDLPSGIEGMKVIGVQGFNVTVPHKVAVIPLLDEIDPLAQKIGAVNTVVRQDDKFVGHNTDGLGFVRALQMDWKEDLADEPALIIGAGGAAQAIYFSLLSAGVKHIDICNRTIEKAKKIIKSSPYEASSRALTLEAAEKEMGNYSLVIQTTSIGMASTEGKSPVSLDKLTAGAFVSDIIYNPGRTAFLKQAARKGAKTQNGVGMLVHQGVLAFEKWTGITPDAGRMAEVVKAHMGG